MFEYNNQPLSMGDLQQGAVDAGMDFDEYFNRLTALGMVEKQGEVVEEPTTGPRDYSFGGGFVGEVQKMQTNLETTTTKTSMVSDEIPQVTMKDVDVPEVQAINRFKKKFGGLGFDFEKSTSTATFGIGQDKVVIIAPPEYEDQPQEDRKRLEVQTDLDLFGFSTYSDRLWGASSSQTAQDINDFVKKYAQGSPVNPETYAAAWNIADTYEIKNEIGEIKQIKDLTSIELADHMKSAYNSILHSQKMPGVKEIFKEINVNLENFTKTTISDLKSKYDLTDSKQVELANKELTELITKKQDELFSQNQALKDIQEGVFKAIESKFDGILSDKLRKEAEDAHLPSWITSFDSDIIRQGYITAAIKFPKALKEVNILHLGIELKGVSEEINFLKKKDQNLIYIDPDMSLMDEGLDERTVADRIKELEQVSFELNKNIAFKLAGQQEYQQKLEDVRVPTIFGKDISDPDLTLDEWQGMLGDQTVQMISAILTMGGSTYIQEGGGAALDIIGIKTARKAYPKLGDKEALEAFHSLPTEDTFTDDGVKQKGRASLMADILNKGEANLMPAVVVGVTNAGLDLVSNFFVIGKATKFAPKSLGRDLLRRRLGDFLASGVAIGKDLTKASLMEFVTETAQEGTSITGVGVSTGYYGNKDANIKRLAEAGGQALLSTGPLVGGGKVTTTTIKELRARTGIFWGTDVKATRNAIDQIKKEYNKHYEDGTITIDERDQIYTELEVQEDFVNNTKYKNLSNDEKIKVIDNLVEISNQKKDLNKLQEENKKIKKEEGITEGINPSTIQNDIKSEVIRNKIRELNNNNLKELWKNDLTTNLEFAEWINNQTEGFFADKAVMTFDKVEDAKNWIEGNGLQNETTEENLQRLYNGEVNGANLGNVAIIVNDNVRSNIDNLYGDWSSSNVVHHESFHFILDAIPVSELQTVRNQVISELEASTDPKIQAALKLHKDKMDLYTADKRTREYNEEWFAVLSDAMRGVKNSDISLENGVALEGVGKIFGGLFQGVTKKGFDFTKFDAQNALEFIKKYNDFNGKSSGLVLPGMRGKVDARLPKKKGDTFKTSKSIYDDSTLFTPEKLIRIIKNPKTDPKVIKAAEEALVPQYEAMALEALKYTEAKGDILRANVVSAVNEYYSVIVKNYKPAKGAFSTHVYGNIKPKDDTIFEKAKTLAKRDESVSLDAKEARQVEGDASITTNTEKTFVQKINVLGFATVSRVVDKIKALVKVKKGDTFKQVISRYAGKIGELVFEIPAKKIMEGGANLTAVTKYKKGMPVPAEAQNIQRVLNAGQNVEKFIKTLPLYNVASKDADINKVGENIEVSRDTYGYAIGLKGLPLDYFYENFTDPRAFSKDPEVYRLRMSNKKGRSLGLTSQTDVKRLKPEFRNPTPKTIEKLRQDLGITPKLQENVYNRDIGQLLKGVAKVYSINAALSAAQRFQEAKTEKAPTDQKQAIKQQTADITAAQSKVAFSESIKNLALNTDKLIWNGKKIILAGRTTYLLRTVKDGVEKGEIVTRKYLDELYDEKNKITWEEFYMNELLDFFKSYPQYYNVMQTALTGGVKKAAFFTKDYFKRTIKKFAKKNGKQDVMKLILKTKQIEPKRLHYHEDSKWKGLDNLDLSKDNGKLEFLINFYSDVSKHVGKEGKGKEIFQEMLTHFGIDQSNAMRHAGVLIGYPVDKSGNEVTNELGVEEHAVQMEMARIMMGMAFEGNMKDANKILKAVYSQISLRKNEDPSGEYKESMGGDFYNDVVPRILDGSLDFLPDGYVSIYRLMKAGVNPFGYKLIGPKQTIAEYFGVNNLSVEKAQQAIIDVFEGKQNIKVLRAQSGVKYSKDIDGHKKINKAINISRTPGESKGITVLDFDDTLATTKSLVKYTTPDGKTGTLNAEQYASTYEDLLGQGYVFDFSEFNKVVKGKIAPLFQKALKLQGKFGPENMFVLTARPPAAQKAIFDFLKANGLNIPIKNITGLANSTSEAKALWMADKVADGYNDFYFADDALQNVQAVKNMLGQFDVKSKVQQARIKFSKSMNEDFNNILEELTGIEAEKRFAATKARKRGSSKGKFRVFIPPSHEDFVGLLYNFMGRGKRGNQHRDFFEETLVKPINRANRELDTARQSTANDYKSLNKEFPNVKKKLTKKTPDGDFNYSDAIRVYLWDKHGYLAPGLSQLDQQGLAELVMADPELQAYAETLNVISKREDYVNPTEGWESGDIRMDLDDATGRIGRDEYFAEFNENADIIFSEENLNKIEAGYGKGVREALEDMLYRIKTGKNRPSGQNAIVNRFMNYLNGSVGSVMFLNMRSALLQQMSIVNYINFADNNVFAAAKAFANQKQYWNDWAFIFNSDMLKQRRAGIRTDVNGAELAETLRKSKFTSRALIAKLLELGFLPTQIGDNIAIATGGAAYYRNRINTYLKKGMDQKEAEAAAFTDFQNITQSTQQSARPDMVSQQQASPIGKVILNFQNVTSQFNRLGKKAFQDIYNRRISPEYKNASKPQLQSDISNVSRIAYYFAIQNLIFYSLQTALFAAMFSDDEEDEEFFTKKSERLINGSIDSVLRGSGVMGAVISTMKNMAIKFAAQRDSKGFNKDESSVVMEMLNVSPVVGIKARKVTNAEKTLNYNKKVIDEMETFDIDNPVWSATTNYIEATTNAPVNRLYNKTQNVRQALDNQNTAWQRALMFLGWSQYNLGIKNQEIEQVKQDIKEQKELEKKNKKDKKNKKQTDPSKRKIIKRKTIKRKTVYR